MIIEDLCAVYFIPSKEYLLRVVSNNVDNFLPVKLFKDTEKERLVFVPKKITKLCQKYILDSYLYKIPCSSSVVSYKKGYSILNNAEHHKGNRYFLHLDIKHYFNRMCWDIFCRTIMKNFPNSDFAKLLVNPKDEKFLRNVLCFKGFIVQGSITSPYISNLYLFELDNFINEEILKALPRGKYTRYSDDLYISSSSYIPHEVISKIGDKLAEFRLKFNYKKIDYKKLKDSVRITGITLTKNKRLVVNTIFKKELKKDIYKCIKFKGKSTNFKKLYGKLNFLKYADKPYYEVLQSKYSLEGISMFNRIKAIEKQISENK